MRATPGSQDHIAFQGTWLGRERCQEGSEIEKKTRVINKISKPNLYTLERRNRGVTRSAPLGGTQNAPPPRKLKL